MKTLEQLKAELKEVTDEFYRRGVDANWSLSKAGTENSLRMSELSSQIKKLEGK